MRIVALAKPTERERTQWYFQRYVPHLPAAGELVLFDRSWYNRAGVEKVMGYCTSGEYELFLKQAPLFEKMLVDDGILLHKYWLTVDQERQEKRFAERAADPLKRWKLSPIDLEARARYVEYGQARDAMFEATHTTHAPWFVVDFNDQRSGRLNLDSALARPYARPDAAGRAARTAAACGRAEQGSVQRTRQTDPESILINVAEAQPLLKLAVRQRRSWQGRAERAPAASPFAKAVEPVVATTTSGERAARFLPGAGFLHHGRLDVARDG